MTHSAKETRQQKEQEGWTKFEKEGENMDLARKLKLMTFSSN